MNGLVFVIAAALVASGVGRAEAHGGAAVAYAPELSGIRVDGDLADWPAGTCWYAVLNQGRIYGPTDVDQADLQASPDLTPRFAAGFDPKENLLYLAVQVRDDSLVARAQDPWSTDACEVYLEGRHQGGRVGFTAASPPSGQTPALQYVLCPPGGSYSPDPTANPSLSPGDLTRTRTRAVGARHGDTTVYEWALEVYDRYPDSVTALRPGKTIGFDVVVVDKDAADDLPAWVCWGPVASMKHYNADELGNLVLIADAPELGYLDGAVTRHGQGTPFARLSLAAWQGDQPAGSAVTDAAGRFRMPLPPGTYALRAAAGQGIRPLQQDGLSVRAGVATSADLDAVPVEVPAILARCAAVYRALRTYRDTTLTETRVWRPGMDNRNTTAAGVAFARPNRIRLESSGAMPGGQSQVLCDGQTLTTYLGMWKQYTQREAAPSLAPSDAQLAGSEPGGPGPLLLSLLLSDDPLALLMERVEAAEEAGEERLDSEPVRSVVLVQSAVALRAGVPGRAEADTVRLWIGARDHLLRRVAYEVALGALAAHLPAEQRAMVEGMRMGIVESHRAVEVDPALAAETFAFSPPAGAQRVDRFSPPGLGPGPSELVGKPAPAFALDDLDSTVVRLEDLAGKVLFVNFWATWCGPCRQELPALVGLQSRYASQGFSVVGISVNEPAATVRAFAQANGLNYPLLLADEQVKRAYGSISAIPTSFVIDRKGVVRYAHMGTPEDLLTFQQEVEALLGEGP